ncbi:phosphate ABC transporter permease family protein, partial [Rhizobium ruizarguesonis]
ASVEQDLGYSMVATVARGLTMMTSDETAAVANDPAALKAKLLEKGVPLASQPLPYMLDAAKKLNAMSMMSRIAMTVIVFALAVA